MELEYRASKTKVGGFKAVEHSLNPRDVKLIGKHGYITKDPNSGALTAVILNQHRKLGTSDFSSSNLWEQTLPVSLAGLAGMIAHLEIPESQADQVSLVLKKVKTDLLGIQFY